ncbi:hypothetical protein FRX31_011159 [Thalictrum thalictroides]|uniref:Uncharacterized protein n=1 Tax=Thalictrum thalictroides TaxID=46969 RepID=A0A7J6WQM2_THATH|nr:hypothetical protein FRX31_011159 [Thalictrum thalictroides]
MKESDTYLQEQYNKDIPLQEAEIIALSILKQVMEEKASYHTRPSQRPIVFFKSLTFFCKGFICLEFVYYMTSFASGYSNQSRYCKGGFDLTSLLSI